MSGRIRVLLVMGYLVGVAQAPLCAQTVAPPDVQIQQVRILPNTATQTFAYRITLQSEAKQPQTVQVRAQISPATTGAKWNYPTLPVVKATLQPNTPQTLTVGPLAWTPGRASWWWPNIPYRPAFRPPLHRLVVTLEPAPVATPRPTLASQRSTWERRATVRFGFCTPGQQGDAYTLNGVRFRLRGDELDAETLQRLEKRSPLWATAIRNYQRLNMNVVKGPLTPAQIALCDELGLCVIAPPPTAPASAVWNAPSLFKWNLADAPAEAIAAQYTALRQQDTQRPCSVDTSAEPTLPPTVVAIPAGERAWKDPSHPGLRGARDTVLAPGELPSAPVQLAMHARNLRVRGDADIRPTRLTALWPDLIPGLTPAPDPTATTLTGSQEPLPSARLAPSRPWADPTLLLLQRSFAPLAVFDSDFDHRQTDSNGRGEWPVLSPSLPAGQTVARTFTVCNDTLTAQSVELRLELALQISAETFRPLPPVARTLTVPAGQNTAVTLNLPVPAVTRNTALEVRATLRQKGLVVYTETHRFVIVPESTIGTQVAYLGRDERTQGNWRGVYGKEAFLIPIQLGRSGFQLPHLLIRRGTGLEALERREAGLKDERWHSQNEIVVYERPMLVNDVRVPLRGPGPIERHATAFSATGQPLLMRIDAKDGKPHQLALYLLDYKREGRVYDLDILDLQGHRLDSRRVTRLGEGAYLRYRFTGSVLVTLHSLTAQDPALSGVFVDVAP